MEYNPEQLQAIMHAEGPCLVLAGPGSGKTAVICERLLYLIEKCGADPASLLTITFTKAAALEMQSRFYKLSGSAYPQVCFGTFHSVFYTILANAVKHSPLRFFKPLDAIKLAEQILKEEGIRYTQESLRAFMNARSKYKNGLRPAAYSKQPFSEEQFETIHRLYDIRRKELGFIGFDDIIPDCIELFQNREEILEKWRARYRFIQTDEFQDVNENQLEILKLLAAPFNNLLAVGDDDQAIYAFRGASTAAVLHFQEAYAACKKIQLKINYRSLTDIIRVSSLVIEDNRNRLSKEFCASRAEEKGTINAPSALRGIRGLHSELSSCVNLDLFKNEAEEKTALVHTIQSFLSTHENKQIAVLTRSHRQLASLAYLFTSHKLPFYLKEKPQALLDHPVTKDICAYLRAGEETCLRSDFLRIMNKPLRYISRETIKESLVSRRRLRSYYEQKPYMQGILDKLFRQLDLTSRLKTQAAISFIRKGIGYDAYCKREMGEADYLLALQILDELEMRAAAYAERAAFLTALEEEKNSLTESVDLLTRSTAADGAAPVRLMTLHASKGLEFHTVMIPFLNEGLLPGRQAASAEAREEERRLLYVGMTRAKDRLNLSAVSNEHRSLSSFIAPHQAQITKKTYKDILLC